MSSMPTGRMSPKSVLTLVEFQFSVKWVSNADITKKNNPLINLFIRVYSLTQHLLNISYEQDTKLSVVKHTRISKK